MLMEIGISRSGGTEVRWGNVRVQLGGQPDEPTPMELLLCALGACTFEAVRAYCRSKGLDPSGLKLEQRIGLSKDGLTVEGLEQRLTLPPEFPEEAKRPLLWIAGNCPAKNLLHSPPAISLTLAGD